MKSLLFTLLVLCSILTLATGNTPWGEVWEGALNRLQGNSTLWNPLLDERIPRLLVILCTGASLAVAGAVMQALFHNPLASPSVLGITCGGGLLVVLVFALGLHNEHPYAVPIASFTGCLATLLLVYALARYRGHVHITTLILTGIAIATLFFAIQEAIAYALRDQWQLIQTITEWKAGSTADRNWKHVHMQLPLTLIGLAGCWHYSREIDILALGEEEAKILGVDVAKVRWRLFLCVSLLTGGAIATVGVIAFFGLVLPHVIRNLAGPDNRRLIAYCTLVGSFALLAMDLMLRYFDVYALSIGNVSAILGGTFFLVLLIKSRKNLPLYAS